jgi:hypothetical protein
MMMMMMMMMKSILALIEANNLVDPHPPCPDQIIECEIRRHEPVLGLHHHHRFNRHNNIFSTTISSNMARSPKASCSLSQWISLSKTFGIRYQHWRPASTEVCRAMLAPTMPPAR